MQDGSLYTHIMKGISNKWKKQLIRAVTSVAIFVFKLHVICIDKIRICKMLVIAASLIGFPGSLTFYIVLIFKNLQCVS